MRYFIILILFLTGCGKPCNHVKVIAIIPAQSTEQTPYNGPCPSTYNKDFSYYEIQWSDGESGCFPIDMVDGQSSKISVGDSKDFCG